MNHDVHSGATGGERAGRGDRPGRGAHFWAMFACCVPMVVIAIVLVVTGVVGVGFVVATVFCVVLMPLLHGHGSHGGGESGHDH